MEEFDLDGGRDEEHAKQSVEELFIEVFEDMVVIMIQVRGGRCAVQTVGSRSFLSLRGLSRSFP